jgi:hypothetical protein
MVTVAAGGPRRAQLLPQGCVVLLQVIELGLQQQDVLAACLQLRKVLPSTPLFAEAPVLRCSQLCFELLDLLALQLALLDRTAAARGWTSQQICIRPESSQHTHDGVHSCRGEDFAGPLTQHR